EEHDAERNSLERLVEDRLADRTNRRFELDDERAARHPAGIDVQRSHAAIIPPKEREEVLREVMLIAYVERAHDAEIDGDVARPLRARHVDEDVARMHVGVKEIVPEDLREEDLDAVLGEAFDVRPAAAKLLHVADRDAADSLHRQHVGAAVIPEDRGHVQELRALEVAP